MKWVNKQKENEREQLLETFFKEFRSWNADSVGMWLVAGIMTFMLGMGMFFPYQELGKEKPFMIMVLYGAFFGGWSYLAPYMQFTEDKKRHSIYEKLQYLPVSLTEIRRFRMRKIVRFYLRLLPLFLLAQLFVAGVAYREIVLGNLLYPIVVGFLMPVGVHLCWIRFSK